MPSVFEKVRHKMVRHDRTDLAMPAAPSTVARTETDGLEFRPPPGRTAAATPLPTPESPKVSRRLLIDEQSRHATTSGALDQATRSLVALREDHAKLTALVGQLQATHAEALKSHETALKSCKESVRQEAETTHATLLAEILQTHTEQNAKLRTEHAATLEELRGAHAQALSAKDDQLTQYKQDHVEMRDLREANGNLFHYALQRPNAHGIRERGSIPRVALEGHPTSLLARQFAGDFTYNRDAEGAAEVHSNPQNWPFILDYLMYNAVPKIPPLTLVDEARHWALDDLADRLERQSAPEAQAPQDRAVADDADGGFAVELTWHNFKERLAGGGLTLRADACGLSVLMAPHARGIYISNATDIKLKTKLRWKSRLGEQESGAFDLTRSQSSLPWKTMGSQNQHRLLSADGALRLTLIFLLLEE